MNDFFLSNNLHIYQYIIYIFIACPQHLLSRWETMPSPSGPCCVHADDSADDRILFPVTRAFESFIYFFIVLCVVLLPSPTPVPVARRQQKTRRNVSTIGKSEKRTAQCHLNTHTDNDDNDDDPLNLRE